MLSSIFLAFATAAFTRTACAESSPTTPSPETRAKALVQLPVTAQSAKAAALIPPAPLSPWQISAGYVWRQLGNLHFNTNARAQSYPIPAFDTSNAGPGGSASVHGGHVYNDGFVSSDSSGPGGSDTWFWGYQSASQLNGNDLAFHGTANQYNQTSSTVRHPGWNSNMAGGGPILSADWNGIELKPGLRLGAEFSASLIQADEGRTLNTLRVEGQMIAAQITDHYTVDPLAVPSAPFSGTFAGPGPTIPSSPASREINSLGKPSTTTYFDEVSERLRLALTTLSLGPRAGYQRDRFSATAGIGLALNIASQDADKTDSLYRRQQSGTALLARWHDHQEGTDVLPGLYMQAGVEYAINAKWSAQVFGRYDWSRALEAQVGGSTFHLGLSGASVGGAVVLRF